MCIRDRAVLLPQSGERGGAHSAAGNDNGFEIEGTQKIHILPGEFQNGFRRTAAIGHTGGITEINDIF